MDLEQIKKFFDKDAFAKTTGAVIEEITDECVTCTLNINENHLNAGGTVQGGAVFTLADFAFAVASNQDDLKAGNAAISVSQSINMLFFRPAKGKKLIVKTQRVQKGRKISVYRMFVTDELGTKVAEMTGNAYRVER